MFDKWSIIKMFDYSCINSRIFEKIAKEYLEDKYPDFPWELTPSSNDGNKDIFCQFRVLGQEQEYWAEAKFTQSSSPHTLMKGQLDPTLVSALLASKPVSICFISNNHMTSQYLYRLKDFRIKTNIGIDLVLKDEFEQWLLNHPAVLKKYNIKAVSLSVPQKTFDTAIVAATITDIFNIGQYKIETHLIKETIYYLYLIITGNEDIKNVSLKISGDFALPRHSKLFDDPNDIHIKPGKQVCKFELLPLQTGRTDLHIQLATTNEIYANYTIPNLTIIPKQNKEISYIEQQKAQVEILKRINESDDHNILIPIIGSGSSGKSRLVQNLYIDISNDNNVMMFSFVDNIYLDMKTIIQMLIFFNIGNIFNYDSDSVISQVNIIPDKEKKIYFAKLISGFFDDPGSGISYLKSKIDLDEFSLIYPCYARVRQILILEDIHKVSKELQEILYKFIVEFLKCKNNQFLILTCREYYKDFVIDTNFTSLKQNWIALYFLHGLSKEDKLRTLNFYLSYNDDIQFDRTTDDLIIFTNILNSVLELSEKDPICRKVRLAEAFENPKFVNTFLYKEQINQLKDYQKIMECVYYINFGIDFLELSAFFQYQDIEFLIKRRLIKCVGGKVYPFHDYYVKAYFEDYKISDSTINILKKITSQSKQDEKKYLYLSLLIESGYSEYHQVEKEAHELEYHYFKITDYYKSYTLANAFKQYINFDERLSFQEVYDLFILAVSSGYFKEPKEVRENYEKVIKYCYTLPLNPSVAGIILRAQSEIINIDYWELNLEKISARIDEILKQSFDITFDGSDDLVCAYLNLLNRKMVVELLYEHYDKANAYFEMNMENIEKLDKKEYIGYLYMDYAKGLYNYDLETALSYMKKAQEIFETVGTEHRRLLDCICEIEYLKCIQSTEYDILKLEYAAEALNNSGFIELYAKSRLKIAAIKMVRGGYFKDDIEKELILSKYVLKYDFTGRLSLLYKMLKNAFSIYESQTNQMVNLTPVEQKALDMMGSDYQKVWKFNSGVFKEKIVFLSAYSSPNEYILDARIW